MYSSGTLPALPFSCWLKNLYERRNSVTFFAAEKDPPAVTTLNFYG